MQGLASMISGGPSLSLANAEPSCDREVKVSGDLEDPFFDIESRAVMGLGSTSVSRPAAERTKQPGTASKISPKSSPAMVR